MCYAITCYAASRGDGKHSSKIHIFKAPETINKYILHVEKLISSQLETRHQGKIIVLLLKYDGLEGLY